MIVNFGAHVIVNMSSFDYLFTSYMYSVRGWSLTPSSIRKTLTCSPLSLRYVAVEMTGRVGESTESWGKVGVEWGRMGVQWGRVGNHGGRWGNSGGKWSLISSY